MSLDDFNKWTAPVWAQSQPDKVREIVEELVARYKDPTQLNGTDYLFIPVDKIKHTLTTLLEAKDREIEKARRDAIDEYIAFLKASLRREATPDVTELVETFIDGLDKVRKLLSLSPNKTDDQAAITAVEGLAPTQTDKQTEVWVLQGNSMTHNTREGCRHCEVAAEQGVTHIHNTREVEEVVEKFRTMARSSVDSSDIGDWLRTTLHHQLQKAHQQILKEIDIGDNDYVTARRAVAELSGVPMMAITFDEHIKVIKEKLQKAHQAGIDEAVEEMEKEIENKLETWAALEHSRWSKWQAYLHSKLYEIDDNRVSANNHLKILPTELWQRWERQIMTAYSDLSEAEKESDREQVRPYIEDIKRTIKALQDNK